jgi:MoaA/NifB/PqqE/SkfB family radical SAM enzyme/tetratricopeptide (TPR) repeat protein
MQNHSCEYNYAKIGASLERRDIFLDGYPIMVHFLMIDKCNVKCIMCGGDYFRSASGRKITMEKFKTMAANLRLEHARSVVLAGAGDPLLNRDLVPIIRFLNNTYPHIAASITTNGLALSEALSHALLQCTLGQVNISINAASGETYRRIMQVDGFDAVCNNARRFAELRAKARRPVSFQFSAAINRLNIEEMPRLVELAKTIGVDSINLFYTRFYPERIRHLNIDDPTDRLENDASLFYHQQLSDAKIQESKIVAHELGIHLMHEPLFKDHAAPCACSWPMTQIMVGFDGEIYPCGGSEVHFRRKVEKGVYDFGNALKAPIDHFWNAEIYRALRVSSRQGERCPIPECRCCANVSSPNDERAHIMQWDQKTENANAVRSHSSEPLVSVIVPTYNRPDQLVRTIESIQAQTYRTVEILVVNDSGPDVGDLLAPLNTRGNITYIRHQSNSGLAAARNTGLQSARGKYIAYLDDDDIYYPDHLKTLVDFLEASEYRVAYTDAYRARQKLDQGRYVTFKREIAYSYDFDYDRILAENFVPVLCFMHERSCLDRVGMFDESLRSHEDWDLWIRMSREFKFGHIKKVTCEFAFRQDGSTMTSGNKADLRETCERMFEKHAGLVKNRPQLKRAQGFMRSALRAAEALQLAFRGEVAGAIQVMTPCLEFDPDNAQTHNVLGKLYKQSGNLRQAVTHFTKAVALDDSKTSYLNDLKEANITSKF